MKKLAAILSAIMLILAITPAAFAAVYTEGYFHYTIADESITITGYFGSEETVTVPAMIAGIPVNTIASGAFSGSGIKVLNLPDTITTIEGEAIDAGVVINYNSNLSSGTQTMPTQPEPTPPVTMPNPPQPNIPGIVYPPPATDSDIVIDDNATDVTVSVSEDVPDGDIDLPGNVAQTTTAADPVFSPEDTRQPAVTTSSHGNEPVVTASTRDDTPAVTTAKTDQPTSSESSSDTDMAIEEVEVELKITGEAATSAEQSDPSAPEDIPAEPAQTEPANPEKSSFKTVVFVISAAAVIAALAAGAVVLWKKKK